MVATPPPARLVLWDVDHTLIETRGVGGHLYRLAFQELTGQPIEREADITGRTESAILSDTLRLHGIEPTPDHHSRNAAILARLYEENADLLRRQGRAMPGAEAALTALARQADLVQAVLTGNLRGVALIKLRSFGLDRFLDLDVGAYGDDDEHRPNLVALAQRRASAKYGATFSRDNTILIGDSVHDAAAGRDGGARVIAVTDGSRNSAEELRDAGADTVVTGLHEVADILAS